MSPPTKELEKLDLSTGSLALAIPERKNPCKAGTMGQHIMVYTNMMRIDFGKNFPDSIIHYDVTIEPERPKYLYRKIFETLRFQHFSNWHPAFDGKKNAYSTNRLPNIKDHGVSTFFFLFKIRIIFNFPIF